MSVTVDVNLLVYASNDDDEAHRPALSFLERLAAGPELVYLFWPVLMSYLRIVTSQAILPRPLTPVAAIENVTRLLERTHVRARGEGERFWLLYRAADGQAARGNAVPDAHLAALMREHGVATIYTRDRGFRRFDGITVRDPLG